MRTEDDELQMHLHSTGCLACGETAAARLRHASCPDRHHWVPGTFDVYQCPSCGLGTTWPQLSEVALDAYYPPSYVSFGAAPVATGNKLRVKRALQRPYELRFGPAARALAPPEPNSRLLDIGCGVGMYLETMSGLGWQVWGIEPVARAAAAAAARLNLPDDRVVVGTANDAKFGEASFDLITLSHSLEHMPDPAAVLARIHGWLAPGGKVRIWLPNFASTEARVFGRLWFGLDVPRHLRHFTPRALVRLLERSGFEVDRLVPEFQASSLEGSVSQLKGAVLRRRTEYRLSRTLYYAVYPLAAAALAFGAAACLDCTATKSSCDDSD